MSEKAQLSQTQENKSAQARDIMSSPVRIISPETTIEEGLKKLSRYGHSGLCVVKAQGELTGIISRRDLDLALHHGFHDAPVKNYMSKNLKTITPDTGLPEIEALMVTYDVGRLPVLDSGNLVGIITRTDVLRQLYKEQQDPLENRDTRFSFSTCVLPAIRDRLDPHLWEILSQASLAAQQKGWHLYLVGGAVRDVLLNQQGNLLLQDLDLVVDGFHKQADTGAGVELASCLQTLYPHSRLSVHGEFQTAVLQWDKDPKLNDLWVDIATARTEFYAYPAANPQVEASSIRQDLYRRDFTINALAVRLTSPKQGELLDFFGGLLDLSSREIRVLHPNSFIEDPTRIYRGARFAAKLKFNIEPQTEEYIKYALESGVYQRLLQENLPVPALTTRLKAELKYILQSPYAQEALKVLNRLGALRCLHEQLVLDRQSWWQIRYFDRLLKLIEPEKIPAPWLIKLEMIIAFLPSNERNQVATNLELPKDTIVRLTELAAVETKVIKIMTTCKLPSEVFNILRQYKFLTILLLMPRNPKNIRRQIWQYLTISSKTQPILNGNDLKKLGYPPGPEFKKILDTLLMATLDGTISDAASAEEMVKQIMATKTSI